MAADINLLVSGFKEQAITLIANCKSKGVEMRPSATLRDPFVQARLWRQSRTIQEITKKINEFNNDGATFLAHCLSSVGPQNGKRVTNAAPGLSWHQWGEALDCFWVVNNSAVWEPTTVVNGINGYMIYANEAKKLGLEAGLFWNSIQDPPHVQLRKASSPLKVVKIKEINDIMEQRFGEIG